MIDSICSLQLQISLQQVILKMISLHEMSDIRGFIWNSDCLKSIGLFGIPQQPEIQQGDQQINNCVLLVIYITLFNYII